MTGAGWITLIVIGVVGGLLATYARLWDKTMPGGLNVIGGTIGTLVISYLVEAFGPKLTSRPQH